MIFKVLEKTLTELIMDLKPAPEVPADTILFESVNYDRSEHDNTKWIELITGYLNTAKTFEIHCWNEEPEWIESALRYGELKNDDWKYGKIITGNIPYRLNASTLSYKSPTFVHIGGIFPWVSAREMASCRLCWLLILQ